MIGIFFIFISLIQLMDFGFWIDINNKIGLNYFLTLIGPILNVGQPLILYIIKIIYFKPKINLTNLNINLLFALINFAYFIYLINMYLTFLQNSNLVTNTSHGHLSWPWIPYANQPFYLIF